MSIRYKSSHPVDQNIPNLRFRFEARDRKQQINVGAISLPFKYNVINTYLFAYQHYLLMKSIL